MHITIQKSTQGWTATFRNSPDMPNGIALPLPFSSAADAETVRRDLRGRFAPASIVTKANSR